MYGKAMDAMEVEEDEDAGRARQSMIRSRKDTVGSGDDCNNGDGKRDAQDGFLFLLSSG